MVEKLPRRIGKVVRDNSHYFSFIILLIYTFLSIKTIFLEGIIPGGDNPVHYVHSYLTAVYMLPKLDILDWDPFNQFGWVFNQYYNPGMNIFISSIYYLFLGFSDFQLAYKIAFYLTYFLMAPAVFMFVYALTNDKIAAIIASFLSITTFVEEKEWLDAGLKQMYYIGMVPERLGLIFAFFSIALLIYNFKSRSLREALFLTGVCSLFFSMTVLTHVMMGVFAACAAILIWFFTSIELVLSAFKESGKRSLKPILKKEGFHFLKLVSVGMLSLGMALFWIIPLFQTLDKYHSFPAITWAWGPSVLQEIFTSMPWYLLIFYSIGAFSPILVEEKPSFSSLASCSTILILQFVSLVNLYDGNIGLRLILAFITSLVLFLSSKNCSISFLLASISIFSFLATGPETYLVYFGPVKLDLLSIIPFARNFGYSKFSAPSRMLILCLSAIGFSSLSRKLYSLSSRMKKFSTIPMVLAGLLAFLIVNASITAQAQTTDLYYPWSREKVFKLTSDHAGFSKINALISWVKNNVPENTYILLQDTLDFDKKGILENSHYVYTASLMLKPVVGGCFGTNYITTPYANSEGDYLLGFKKDELLKDRSIIPRLMDELGIGYIALHDPLLINALNSSSDFILEYYDGLYAVFRKNPLSKIVSIEGEGTVESVNFTISRIEVIVSGVSGNESSLVIRQVNFPGFTAIVNNETIQLDTYYPNIPSVIVNWQDYVPTVYNLRIPFIKIRLPPGSNKVILVFKIQTVGSTVSQVAWLIFLLIIVLSTVMEIVQRFKKKWN
ncbi:MAG: hypothetical protein FGF52_05535 [Candidatus Brockarchaeota archaeon]|nr:hypothetical protein [Candidatus Brockarchaeota archaeon]